MDGEEIGGFTDAEHLRAGQEFTLDDGSYLSVQLTGGKMFPLFKILKDGQPLTTAGPGAADRLGMTCKIMYVVAFANLFAGIMGILPNTSIQMTPSVAWYSVITGFLFFVLVFFVKRKSMLALGIAVGIFALGGISFLIYFRNLSGLAWLGLFLRVCVLFVMVQGLGAIQAIKQEEVSPVALTNDE